MADQNNVISSLGAEIVVIEASGAQAYGLPPDGVAGQKIRKSSSVAYDTAWVDDFFPSNLTPSPLGIADPGQEALGFARADHVHEHGNLGGGALHANATISQSGFFSAADKQKLDAANAGNVASAIVRRDASGGFSAGLINASITGNADSAAKLEVARLINGVPFDGTADVNIVGNASLTQAGIVQLSNSLSSTSVTQAATPSTVNILRQKLEAFRNSRKIFVSLEGSDSNDGTSEGEPLRTVRAAMTMAQPGDVIKIASGDYTEICPMRVPRNVGVWGDSLRNVFIRPTTQTATKGIFKVDSGFLAQGITFAGHQATLNEQGWAISFDELADNSGLGATGPGAYIQVSPYIRNCTSYTAAQGDGFAASTSQGITGGGMEIDGAKCAPNSPIRSMVVDSFTQINLNGPGCLVKNNGYAQLVSFFGTFCSFHVKAESGGQVNLSNSTTDFGTFGLMADGFSPEPVFIGTAGTAAFGAALANFTATIDLDSNSFEAIDHGLTAGTKVFFQANQGDLPPELEADTAYFVVATGLSANNFRVATVFGGVPLTFSGPASGLYGVTIKGDSEIDVVGLTPSSIGPVSRPQPGMLMIINGEQYVITGSVPISGGFRVNFFNNVNAGLFAPISQGEPINFHLRSQVSTGGHVMEFVGSGTNYNALPWFGGVPIPANQIVETNGGRVFFSTTDELGNFRVGDAFDVDGTTGAVTINTSQFNLSGLNFIGPFSRNGGLSVVGVQLREISNNPELIASTGVADGNTVPTQFAVKTYTETRLAEKVDALIPSAPITATTASAGDPAIKTVTVGITNATASAAGAMSAADKARLDAGTPAGVAGTLVQRDENNSFAVGSITGNLDGNANSADEALKWSTGRTISLSGDVLGTSAAFDGSANLSFLTNLAVSGVTAGTYKSVTVDAKGRVTAGTNPTTVEAYGITNALTSNIGSDQTGYFQSFFLKDADNPSHYLQFQVNEDLTANRLLAISVGNADRQLSMRGNVNFGGAFSTTEGYNLSLLLTGTTNVTLPTSGTLAVVDSQAFTGIPTVPTAAVGTNTTQIANTQFVRTEVAALVETTSEVLDALNELSDALGDDPNFATTISNELGLKAPLESPALTGVPTAPTATAGTSTTQLATTAFVTTALSAISLDDGTY